jgi:D-alanine-D-alanine ligase
MKVLVLHTLAPSGAERGRSLDEFDLQEGAEHVASALDGAVVSGVRGEAGEIVAAIAQQRPEVVFNLCEAPLGRPALEAHAAALLEWLGVPFTGARSQTLALARCKPRMNAVLHACGVPLPREGVYPAIVKPADEDGSAGIDADSVCDDEAAVRRARTRWPGPVLVQEFLPGREFAVSAWGRDGPEHLSIGETRFRNGLRLNTYRAKWELEGDDYANSPLDYGTPIDASLRAAIVAAARGAWRASAARGYLRVDVRCNAQGTPCVLDVNPNPAIGPDIGICRAVQEAGWSWARFVALQLEVARCS